MTGSLRRTGKGGHYRADQGTRGPGQLDGDQVETLLHDVSRRPFRVVREKDPRQP